MKSKKNNNKSKKLNNKRYKKSKKNINIDFKKGGFFFSDEKINNDTFSNSSISNLYNNYKSLLIELLLNSKFKLLSDTSLYGLIFLGEIKDSKYYFTDSEGVEITKYIIKGSFITEYHMSIEGEGMIRKQSVKLKEFENEIKIQKDIYLKSLERYYEPIVPDIQLIPTSIKLDKLDDNRNIDSTPREVVKNNIQAIPETYFQNNIDRIPLQYFIDNIIYKDDNEKDKIKKYFEKIDNTNITFRIFIMKYIENYYTLYDIEDLLKEKIFQDYNAENEEGLVRKKYNEYTDYVDSLIRKKKKYTEIKKDINSYIEYILELKSRKEFKTEQEHKGHNYLLWEATRELSRLRQDLNRHTLKEEENKKLELLQKPKYIYSLYHILLGLLGYIHGDAHGGNIMIYYDKDRPEESLDELKAYIIDFGRIKYDKNLDYDIIQNPNPQIKKNKIFNVIKNIDEFCDIVGRDRGYKKHDWECYRIYRLIDKFDIKKIIKIVNQKIIKIENQKLININFEKNKIEIYKQLSNYNISKSKKRDDVIESDNIQNNQESYNHEVSKPKTKKKTIFNRFRIF